MPSSGVTSFCFTSNSRCACCSACSRTSGRSAHGAPVEATFDGRTVRFAEAHRRVAPGQSVVLYRDDEVAGGGIAV